MSQNINLHQGTRRRRVWLTRGGVGAIALLALVGGAAVFQVERTRLAQLQAQSTEAARTIARLEKQITGSPNAAQQAQETIGRAEAEVASLESVAAHLNSGMLGRTTGFTGALRALASGQTEGVWLTGIRLDNAGAQLALEGKALDPARVPLLIERLRRMPQFSGTSIATLELKHAEEAGKQAPATLVQFRLATPVIESANGTPGAKP